MKRHQWLLFLFAAWSILCIWWYLFELKEITANPALFDPAFNALAIFEVSTMILGSTLIGFAISLAISKPNELKARRKLLELLRLRKSLLDGRIELKSQIRLLRQQLGTLQHFSEKQDLRSKKEIENLQKENFRLQKLETDYSEQKQLGTIEIRELREILKTVEQSNMELTTRNEELKNTLYQIGTTAQSEVASQTAHPFIKNSALPKDDLTRIKGIGPFIEKRLNMLGVFNFQQLSQFTREDIELVSRAIEFFPQRILKDDWAGQAKKLIR